MSEGVKKEEQPVKMFVRGRNNNGLYQYFIVLVSADTHEELARGRIVAVDYDLAPSNAWADLLSRLRGATDEREG